MGLSVMTAGPKVLISAMKDEGPYILEWVAHHKVIGFDEIIVYTNDCSDGTNKILKRLEQLGYIKFHNNRVGTGGVHRSALRQARRLQEVKDAAWIYVTDADEFLNIHVGNGKLDDLIAATGADVDVIPIPWRIFSNNGRHVLRNSRVCTQFTDAEPTYEDGGAGRRFVKSLFRNTGDFYRFGLHNPHEREEVKGKHVWALPGGHQKTNLAFGNHVPPPFGHEIAQINHYAVRSTQAYLNKRYRGRANHMSHLLGSEYWERWNRGGVKDDTIGRYDEEVSAQLNTFMSDADLSREHRAAFRFHKRRLQELLALPEYTSLYSKLAKLQPINCPRIDRKIRPTISDRANDDTVPNKGAEKDE